MELFQELINHILVKYMLIIYHRLHLYLIISQWIYFFVILGLYPQHMYVPRLGLNQSCSCQPANSHSNVGIQATSWTYTTAHGNAGSSMHWARPGIEPASSWILVRFVSTEPQWELLHLLLFFNSMRYS